MHTRCRDIDVAWFEVGRGEPLVLIHGLADDHRAWRRTIPFLALTHRVLLYDLRGHGETTLGRPDGTLIQLAEDLAALMSATGLAQADVAGFSLGGTIAMRLGIDHPDLVRRLVLVATSSRVGRAAADWYAQRVAMVDRGDPELQATLERDTADVYAQAPGELSEGWLIRRESTTNPQGYRNACAAMASLNAAPLDPELSRISAPTLIVAADQDRHCPPKAAEIIAAGIDGAAADVRLEIFQGAGHAIPLERPAELGRLINTFLAND